MPFTAAHPAAVLPLGNRFPRLLPWSALVVGSVTPDFDHFLLGTIHARSHSLPGLFLFCLPVGVLTWAVFHLVVKRPMAYLLPDSELGYLWPLALRRVDLSLRSLAGVGLAVVVGAASHLLWDSFTHDGAWAAERVAVLSRTIAVIDGYRFTVSRLAQHVSTVVGLAVLAASYWRWRSHQAPVEQAPRMARPWRILFFSVLVVVPLWLAGLYTVAGGGALHDIADLRYWVWRFVTAVLGLGMLSVLFYSMVVLAVEARLTGRSARTA